ncbi:sensor histidine kinase [Paenibacillus sediminis]|uniref:histidine kinase n=1 Tax=Paenibacillus sediminis TaxID=664909 RepID=A0ABS4H0W1_9BACL|nr:sensor histidine kinase [Paenibacillus sediminis]MBP1936116.1 two-component system sensor histidine kinase YesM [Paenibacillus sediminis]
MKRGFNSIHNRLFLLILFCMSAILLIISLLFYNRTTMQYHDKISDLSQKNVSQTVGLFGLLSKGYDSLSKSISNNFDLVRLLSETTHEPALEYINEQSITNIIGAIFYSRDDLVGIHIITDKGKIYNYGNYMNVVDPNYMNSDWYHQIHDSTGKMVWLGVYPHSIIDQMEKRPVFAFGRQIYDLNEHRPIGIVLYETDPKPILSALNNLRLGEHSKVYLVSHRGRVVSSTSSDAELLPNDIPLPGEEKDVIVEQRNGSLIVASKLPFADWSVVSVTPNQDLNVELTQTKRYLAIVVTVLILVATLIASIVSRTISSPLIRLIKEMKHVEIGNFRGVLNVTSYQEINILVASFNQMVTRIEELIERVKTSSVSERTAELHALQSQVNPHFLYNTLDMIYWMLDEKGQDKLGEVVLSLSHMFRYSSHWEEEVTLREEVEQIEHYLTIISYRLEGRLTVDVSIDERWMNFRLPKMTLQPIIENAVKHGLESLSRTGVLKVHAAQEGQTLNIMIEDNGRGMDEAKLNHLRVSIHNEQSGSKGKGGIGLQNLQRRLRHMYGDGYGIQIESASGQGTTVVIVMPLEAQRRMEA